MKCPVCGRENPDIRLFCMQCGELLPEAEEGAAPAQSENIYAKPAAEEPAIFAEPEDIPAPEESVYEAEDDTEFYRQRQRARGFVEETWPESAPVVSRQPQSIFDEPVDVPEAAENLYARPAYQETQHKPELNRQMPVNGRGSTFIPKREASMDPDDFFAVRGQVLPEYDEEEEAPKRRRTREGDYEDQAHQSFAVRHMRGIVTLLLLLITAAIVVIWANTDSAQYTLAKADMAWKSSAYERLAEEASQINDLAAAGYYYTAALKRDENNLNYAIMAANSYIEGGYTSKALDAIRKCIEIQPANADLYATLIQLSPEISAADKQLIRQGYELTGDSRLNIE